MLALSAASAPGAETATANDTARFLAGLPPAPDSPLAVLATTPLWQQHERYFNAMFGQEERSALGKIRTFSQERLPDDHRTLLYMFSGPDFLYANAFFPHAPTYILSGLEPVGEVPQLARLAYPTLEWTLRKTEDSLGSLLSFSFFITRKMKAQLHGGPVYGTLPILYVFLARSGKTIREVSFVHIDADGTIQAPSEAGADRPSESAANGVKIAFTDANGDWQTLYYFSTNLANDSVKRSGFLAFCEKFGLADSFLKSASYLLYGGGFSNVRNFMLDHSATILEDDSGIPLAYFEPRQWQLQPIGRYLGPIAEFARHYQPAMAQLFRIGNPVPIDFGVGYRWRRNESNLLLAHRIAPATSEIQLAPH
ncbi:MAG TPA: hypothetical protein VGJ20_22260 [Xanthobacteraceae bacterium]